MDIIPLGLYVHLPWCRAKCPYCDFNSYAVQGTIPAEQYVETVIADLGRDAGDVIGRRLATVFFGGGTPSLFSAAHIEAILRAADQHVGLEDGVEVTMEANPGALESGPLADYRAAGVNRLSLGVQTLDDAALRQLGRLHDSATAIAAVLEAKAAGFDNLNVDLMYGLPGQSVEAARHDVDRVMELAPSHISHYQLTLEPNTVFYTQRPALPDEETCWAMQEDCQAALAREGYAQYEVSAFAQDGRQCRHNLNYWRYGDYIGVGAGAHGKLTDSRGRVRRTVKPRHPRGFRVRQLAAGTDVARPEAASRAFEFLLNALRLVDGFEWREFERRTGVRRGEMRVPLKRAIRDGLLTDDGRRCRTTERGFRFLDELLQRFLPEPNAA